MGQERETTLRYAAETARGTALLETDEILFRPAKKGERRIATVALTTPGTFTNSRSISPSQAAHVIPCTSSVMTPGAAGTIDDAVVGLLARAPQLG